MLPPQTIQSTTRPDCKIRACSSQTRPASMGHLFVCMIFDDLVQFQFKWDPTRREGIKSKGREKVERAPQSSLGLSGPAAWSNEGGRKQTGEQTPSCSLH